MIKYGVVSFGKQVGNVLRLLLKLLTGLLAKALFPYRTLKGPQSLWKMDVILSVWQGSWQRRCRAVRGQVSTMQEEKQRFHPKGGKIQIFGCCSQSRRPRMLVFPPQNELLELATMPWKDGDVRLCALGLIPQVT